MALLPESFQLTYNLILGCVFLFGLLGNLLVLLAALTQKTAHKAVKIYLANLAVADILHLLSVPPLIHMSLVNTWQWGRLACKLNYMMHYINWTASVFIIVAMTFDRYVAVAAPAGWVTRCRSPRFARRLLGAQWLLSALAMSPMLLCTEVTETMPVNATTPLKTFGYRGGRGLAEDAEDDGGDNPVWSLIVNFVHDPVKFGEYTFALGCVVPAVLLAVFYSLILCRLRPGRATWNPNRRLAQRRFGRVTRMAASVVVFYAVCSAPHWVHLHLALYLKIRNMRQFRLLAIGSHVTTLLGYANSAGNPVVYAYFNEPFRAGVHRVLYGEQRARERRTKIARRDADADAANVANEEASGDDGVREPLRGGHLPFS